MLSGKTALVTGGSRGIGRAIAERLASAGARVMLTYRERRDDAENVVGIIKDGGGSARALALDLGDEDSIARAFGEIGEATLDILVNNAGVSLRRPLAETSTEDWDQIFRINARGTFLCCRYAVPRLSVGGRIVNLITGAIAPGPPGSAAYAGSKAAVHQITKALARELAARGVTVNSVAPGPTDTDMLAQYPGARESSASATPLQGLAEPYDVAAAVAFLASDEARWITGQLIHINGGLVMA